MRQKHYPALDGLRGVAILMVMLHHFSQSFASGSIVQTWMIEATRSFWIGVDLFFVLSGFLITGILLDTREAVNPFRTFYARRVLRIFPLYYGYIFLVFLILPWLGIQLVDVSHENAAYYWSYAANLRVAWHGWPSLGLAHLWSLSIEEQFYLVWPMVILFVPLRALKYLLPSLIVLPMLLRVIAGGKGTYLPVYASTLTRADALFVGAFIAMAIRAPERHTPLRWLSKKAWVLPITIAFVGAGTLDLGYSFYPDNWTSSQRIFLLLAIALAFGWLLLHSLSNGSLSRALERPVLKWFGKYSYGLYLLHMPLVLLTNLLIPSAWVEQHIPFHPLIVPLYVTPYFAISCVGALLSWKILEQPLLRLKRFFPYREATAQEDVRSSLLPTT